MTWLQRTRAWSRLLVGTAVVFVSVPALAASTAPSGSQAQPLTNQSGQNLRSIYAAKTDQQLRIAAANWGSLDAEHRNALVSEVKLRMARSQRPSAEMRGAVVQIRSVRQYGVVRKPDGTTVRVQRQVVRIVPVKPGRGGFGTGFERRAAQVSADTDVSPELEVVEEPKRKRTNRRRPAVLSQ